MDTAQAEAVVHTIVRTDAELATKADVDALGATTKADIATPRSEMRWMFGFLAALVLAIAGRLFGVV